MTLTDDLQQAVQLIQNAQSAADLLAQDKLTLKADNDALRRQLVDCEQGQPTTSFDAKLARVADSGLRLRVYNPDVPLDPTNPPPEIRKMDKGTTVICWTAKLAGTGIFQDTSFIPPEAALQLPFEARWTEATNTVHVWMLVDDLQSGDRGWCAAAWLTPVDAPTPPPVDEPTDPGPVTDFRVPLGPYYNRLDEERLAEDIIRSKVPVVLLNVGENEAIGGVVAKRALEDDPNRLVIIRNTSHRSIDNLHRDIKLEHFWTLTDFSPEDAARHYWRFMSEVINGWGIPQGQRHNLGVMPINEWDGIAAPPPGQRATALARMNAFYMQLMQLVQADGYKVVLWPLPEGNPEPGEWDHCRPSITNAALYGHIIGGPHAYFEAKEGSHGYTDPAYTLRFLDLWQKCDAWGIDRPRVVLTELALTSALHDGVGYRGVGMSAQTMLAHVRKVLDALQFYGVAATLFAQNVYDDFDSFNYGDDRQIVYDILADWNTV